MTYRYRAGDWMTADVGPYAAAWLLRRDRGDMQAQADALAAMGRHDLAGEFRSALRSLSRCVAQLDPTSAVGSAEVPRSPGSGCSESPSGGPGLTTGEVARILGLRSARQVNNLIGNGRLRATSQGPGRPWAIDPESVTEELDRRSAG